MPKEQHIHIHLHTGPFEAMVQDAGAFEEAKHKREGGKFSSSGGGGGGGAAPMSTAAKFAAKHNPAAAAAAARNKGAGPQGEKAVAEEKASLL